MTVIWLALTVLLCLAVANLLSDLANMDALIAQQRAIIDRQTMALDDDTILIHNLRSQLILPFQARLYLPDVPMITGPTGPITLN